MPELTLESLNARLAEVERLLAAQTATPSTRKKDWRRTVGMFTGSEFMKQVDAEGQAVRDADRDDARTEPAS